MERNLKKLLKKHFAVNLILTAVIAVVAGVCIVTDISASVSPTSTDNGAIYHGNIQSGGVSLMFNVYGGTEEVRSILKTLKETSSKATFFIGGCWADDNVEVVNEILASGHEIGSHGYYHKDHAKLNLEQNTEEISYTHQLILATTGVSMNLFAPPSGSFSETTVKACENLNYRVIMWTADTIDWRDQDQDLIHKRAVKNLASGNFILMHPTKATALALNKIISSITSAGLKTLTVSENLEGIY